MEAWFAKGLVTWYKKNKRELPWRDEKDAYKIWLSEVILQQTQVIQGLNYYKKFTSSYPTVNDLAEASEDEVLRHWQGLGYYSRARNLHYASKTIVNEFKGQFPNNYDSIRKLKGVGDYTAAAISSFAFNLPHAVVDGNVYRVLSRVFGLKDPIDTPAAKKKFQILANGLLDKKDPATYNQAIMEFGSQYCKPANPDCLNCHFQSKCFAFSHNLVSQLPLKAKKTKIRNRYFNYLVELDQKGQLKVYRRNEKDIWKGLYEFYLIESESELTIQQVLKHEAAKKCLTSSNGIKFASKLYKHVLSHQHLYARFYIVLSSKPFNTKNTKADQQHLPIRIKIEELKNHAFSRLTLKFLDDCLLKEII